MTINVFYRDRARRVGTSLLLVGAFCVTTACAPKPTNQAAGTPGTVATTPAPSTSSPGVAASGTPQAVIQPTYQLNTTDLASSLPSGVTVVDDQQGRPNQALAFNGQESRVELPWDINAKAHPQLTITAWARFTGNPEEKAQAQVVSHDNGSYDRSVGLDGRAGEWGWSAFAGSAGVIGGVPVKPGDWTFLAVTYDQSAKTTGFSVNGTASPQGEGEIDEGHPFVWLGGNPSFGEHFVGEIAHVKVYDRVLSPAELSVIEKE